MKVQFAAAATLTAVALSCPAKADVVPIGEFIGDIGEGMESVGAPGGGPGPVSIFGGAATVDDALAHFIVIAFVWQGSGPDGQIGNEDDIIIEPLNGNLFGGAVAGPEVYTFDPPVAQFGGFFTTVGNASDGTVVFRDSTGAQIGDAMPMTIVPGEWIWQGWSSDVPIATVEITSNNPLGMASVQFDDLQLSYPDLCPADTDGSGAVDVDDLIAVILAWGECPAKGACPADIDDSGAVDVDDLIAVILAWGACS